jgi:hypothetical protein
MRASKIGGKKGCLCKDGKYHKDCCKGEPINQGIGTDTYERTEGVVNVDTTRNISNTLG